uniref:Putative transporter n=1 Tax=Aedes albopictus TaxID=7160 RepID=A0A023EP82_AEDAL|nr:alpha-tocopherol transfer protein-like [Aedes albopictus]XP_029719838.1 alpha-tocopherol transfer protein-like [Aedes albopictus]XP_029719987.1 alpha-tocopherol transfer protein-like [Aedes albopictus]
MAMLKFDENKVPYIDLGKDYCVRLENDEFTDAKSKEKAARELRETPDVIAEALKELRAKLQEEKSLYVPIDDDSFLMKFLRPCKFYPSSAFALIQRYYRFKLKHPDACEELLPSTVQHVYDEDLLHFQPLRDQNGCRILVMQVGRKWKPSKVSLNDLFRAMQVALEAGMTEPRTQLNGAIVILDMDGLSLSQILQFTPRFAAMAVEWVQECTAIRLKAIHIVNNSYLFNMLFTIFKPFLSEKLRKRISFHGKDWKSLTSFVDPICLWPRYGGTLDAPEFEGRLVGELFALYQKEYEVANSYGYTKKV